MSGEASERAGCGVVATLLLGLAAMAPLTAQAEQMQPEKTRRPSGLASLFLTLGPVVAFATNFDLKTTALGLDVSVIHVSDPAEPGLAMGGNLGLVHPFYSGGIHLWAEFEIMMLPYVGFGAGPVGRFSWKDDHQFGLQLTLWYPFFLLPYVRYSFFVPSTHGIEAGAMVKIPIPLNGAFYNRW